MDKEQLDGLIATQRQFVLDLNKSIDVLEKHRKGTNLISDEHLARILQENKNLSNEIPKLSEIIKRAIKK